MLYRSTNHLSRCGAPVKNLSHSASFESFDKNAPLKSGTKQLAKMEGHCGAIAFSRTGDPSLGDFDEAVILKTVGEVDPGLLSV
jgi:hypothetical protein